MTLKEFKVHRALGTAENTYLIVPDNFWGKISFSKVRFDNTAIRIPYWLARNIKSLEETPASTYTLIFDYIETQLT